jgi:hypothetical protein
MQSLTHFMPYISMFSTLITFAFAAAVFERYRRRGGAHLLMWGIGLVFYGLGTLSEAFLIFSFQPLALKIWYLSGAMLTAAWLGQGTIHLLWRKGNVAWRLTTILALVSLAALALVLVAPINSANAAAYLISQPVSGQYKAILGRTTPVIILTILLNIYGTVGLVGGALYSAYIFWRKHVLADRMYGNILIAAGALFPAMAGTLIKAGLGDWLYVSEFIGVVLMYAGFIKATAYRPVVEPEGAAASAH